MEQRLWRRNWGRRDTYTERRVVRAKREARRVLIGDMIEEERVFRNEEQKTDCTVGHLSSYMLAGCHFCQLARACCSGTSQIGTRAELEKLTRVTLWLNGIANEEIESKTLV